jgi:uridine phosphorylase
VALEHRIRANHLRPATDLAERVLLPGDPHRALSVAQELLDKPLMFNHARGLWGYTGRAEDGEPLSIQSTGMGGPSAAIVVEELIALGARRLVRIGTCGALRDDLEVGSLLAAVDAIPADGTSRALGANGPMAGDAGLTERLVDAGAEPVTVATTDLFYDERDMRDGVAAAVEMETATLFTLAALRGAEAGAVLGVTDVPADGGARRASPEELEEIGLRVGRAGYAALRTR